MENRELFDKIDQIGKEEKEVVKSKLLLSERKFHHFGGWHLFFYVALIINIIVSALAIFSTIIIQFEFITVSVSSMITFLLYIIAELFISIKIVDKYRSKKTESLSLILKYLRYLIVFRVSNILFVFILDSVYFTLSDIVFSIISICLWYSYFEKSKRVEIYYNPNRYE